MKKLALTLLVTIVAAGGNAQTIIGTRSADSLNFYTSNILRMFIKSNGQVAVNNGNLTEVGGGAATMGIAKRNVSGTLDKIGLLISDNTQYPIGNTQLGIVAGQDVTNYGIYAVSTKRHTSFTNGIPDACGMLLTDGNIGYFRYNRISNINFSSHGFVSHTYVDEIGTSNTIGVGFRSKGGVPNGRELTEMYDFRADNFDIDTAGNTTPHGARYGLWLGFTRQDWTAAWGIYQAHATVKNFFNGPSMFGTTTDNGIDKAQVVGGLLTGGLSTSDTTVAANYTITNDKYTIRCNTSSGSINVTLPTSGIAPGKIFVVKRVTAGAHDATVIGDIDGTGTNYLLDDIYDCVTVQFNGTGYDIIAEVLR